MTLLFAAAMFTNALLLFFVQPMFAKLLLPLFGGSPAVWTTCMLFFQTALLAGYFYSHALVKLSRPWQQAAIHGIVVTLPILTLPITVSAGGATTDTPISSVLQLSAISVGAPFFVLATSAPLLQRWFAAAHATGRVDPYFLYAASNIGSFASLMLYPTVVEPTLALSTQTRAWSFGYAAAVILTLTCALVMWRRGGHTETAHDAVTDDARVTFGRRLRWIALAFVPSSLMLAVTAYLTTDVAAVPLLWVVPLALYLITFVVTFSTYAERADAISKRIFPLLILLVTFLLVGEMRLPLLPMAAVHLGAFFVVSMLCHGALAADRPQATHLTDFYLSLAIGGALGGVFNSLLAPMIFTGVREYPIVLGAGILLLTVTPGLSSARTLVWWLRPAVVVVLAAVALKLPVETRAQVTIVWTVLGVATLVAFSMSRDSRRFGLTLAAMLAIFIAIGGRGFANVVQASRTFFGTYRVSTDAAHRSYTLFHGTTIHGRQNVGSHAPLTYYHPAGPIYQVFATRPAAAATSVGVVGLGTGTLASYAKPGQHWVFYEIDPEVERIARDTRFFTHLSTCGAACEVVIGDARLAMQQRSDRYDVIVLDAFSSDAIPIHLLTREAVGLYLSRLEDDGILVVHISNNHLNLVPVVAGLVQVHGLVGRTRLQPGLLDTPDLFSSHWAVVARNDAALGPLAHDKKWKVLEPRDGRVWTDDFSNIWTAIQWRH